MAGFRVLAGLGRNCTKGLGGCFPEESISHNDPHRMLNKVPESFSRCSSGPEGCLV